MDDKTEKELLDLLHDLEKVESTHREVFSKNFNMFEAAGMVRQEIRHSNVLSFLINPSQPHGLNDGLLRRLIHVASQGKKHKDSPKQLDLALADFSDIKIRREEMHLDILAYSPKNQLVVVLENKVDASEGFDQLSTYREKIQKDARFDGWKKLFVYLTIDGEEPSDSDWWVPLSYNQVLTMVNEAMAQSSELMSDDARMFVKHYIDLIGRVIVSEIDADLKEACMALYEKHEKIINIILKNIDFDGPRIDAIKTFLTDHDGVEIYINRARLHFLPSDLFSAMPDVEFERAWAGQQNRKPITFWFEFDSYIKLVVEVGPWVDKVARKKLVDALNLALYKKVKNTKDTYTRVWSHIESINERATSEEMLEVMTGLFDKLEQDKVIEKVSRVISEIWPQQ